MSGSVKEGKILNIVVGGEAGQGIGTLGILLCKCLVRGGYRIVVTQTYESRIRGGHNTFAIRAGNTEITAPQETIDVLVALDAVTVALHEDEMSDRGIMLVDAASSPEGDPRHYRVPFKELGGARLANVIALGIVSSTLGLEASLVLQTLDDVFGKKGPAVLDSGREAVQKALSWAANNPSSLEPLPRADGASLSRMMLNGNEAIALGALSSGLRFVSFYPMSPATSISLEVTKYAESMGVVVEQAEDEIGAINMAIGASFAGAPSMVATSGGGFALMTEAVSLAGISETPLVVAVAQRPGPATGLATHTEQADLELVLHAGHGEFPRAILTPGCPEECFHLTRKAFELAEKYQGPVFLLTDQYLADSYRAVTPFDLDSLPPVRPGVDAAEVTLPYQRFALTPDGVSPRLVPGATEHLVRGDSHEHTEEGRLTEDPVVRAQMVEKRLKKLDGLRKDSIAPERTGDDNPELLLVSWGSTKGSVAEAASLLRNSGTKTATLHFSQVWPMAQDRFLRDLEAANKVVCVEGNATGQLAKLIRRETGFEIASHVRRYDGLPITPEYILRKLKSNRIGSHG